jgi:hypothetical protein
MNEAMNDFTDGLVNGSSSSHSRAPLASVLTDEAGT